MPVFPELLDPAYAGEDYEITLTLSGSGSISGWTLDAVVTAPDGTDETTGVTCAILVAADRTVRVTITGKSWTAGKSLITVRRTDAGARTVVYEGYLPILSAQS